MAEEHATRPSREPMRLSDLGGTWFAQEPALSWPPPSIRPPPPPIGDPMWSAVFGAIAGGLGACTMLIVVQTVISATSGGVDIVRMLAAWLFPGAHGLDPRIIGLAAAAMVGAVVGAGLCRIARRLLRIGPRLVFFSVLLPVLWIFVQAFVLGRFAPDLRLPLVPLLIGAIGYGACLAVVQPVQARK